MTSSAKIYRFGKVLAGFAVIAAAVALCAPAPNAGSEHFVITNNNYFKAENSGTILRLGGTRANPTLTPTQTLETGITTAGALNFPSLQIAHAHGQACIFLGNAETAGNAISAFKFPGLQLVGNYSDPNLTGFTIGFAMASHENSLYVSLMSGPGNDHIYVIDAWQINDDCSLSLLHSTSVIDWIYSLEITPDGKTLIGDYADKGGTADSFAVGADGTLTELGPFGQDIATGPGGGDVTADGKYVFFTLGTYDGSGETELEAFAVNSNGTLGTQQVLGGDGQLGPGPGTGGFLRLSPDEKFLFVDTEGDATDTRQRPDFDFVNQVTTLNFSENPFGLTYSGCLTTLKVPQGDTSMLVGGMATVEPSGAGGGLYVSEYFNVNSIALLAIDAASGCTSEIPNSPFIFSTENGALTSLLGWPPRPF
jgi:hypothetical protein